MRYVPAHKQTDGDTSPLTPAKWPIELVLISNKEGRNQFVSKDRMNEILAPALRNACYMATKQLKFFPNTRVLRG